MYTDDHNRERCEVTAARRWHEKKIPRFRWCASRLAWRPNQPRSGFRSPRLPRPESISHIWYKKIGHDWMAITIERRRGKKKRKSGVVEQNVYGGKKRKKTHRSGSVTRPSFNYRPCKSFFFIYTDLGVIIVQISLLKWKRESLRLTYTYIFFSLSLFTFFITYLDAATAPEIPHHQCCPYTRTIKGTVPIFPGIEHNAFQRTCLCVCVCAWTLEPYHTLLFGFLLRVIRLAATLRTFT